MNQNLLCDAEMNNQKRIKSPVTLAHKAMRQRKNELLIKFPIATENCVEIYVCEGDDDDFDT